MQAFRLLWGALLKAGVGGIYLFTLPYICICVVFGFLPHLPSTSLSLFKHDMDFACKKPCVGAALAKQPLASSKLVWMRSLAGSWCLNLETWKELHWSVGLMIVVGKQSLTRVGLEAKRCYRFGMMTSSRNAGLTLGAFVFQPYTRWMARLFAEIDNFTPQAHQFLVILCQHTCALTMSPLTGAER